MKLTGKTQADLDLEAAAKEVAEADREALAYLAATDWYAVRKAETGEEIPQEILDNRAAARAAVAVPVEVALPAAVTAAKGKVR